MIYKEEFSSVREEVYIIIYDLAVMRTEFKHFKNFVQSVKYFYL